MVTIRIENRASVKLAANDNGGFFGLDPVTDEIVLVTNTYSRGELEDRFPGFQDFARDFEESILTVEEYVHPDQGLHIRRDPRSSPSTFSVYIRQNIWGLVNALELLALIRTHALTRKVVTNVPRPNDPTIFLGLGHVISAKDGGRVIVINNASRSHTHRIDPRDFVRAYRTSRFAGGYPLDSKPGCPSTNILSLIEHGVESLFVFWPDSADEKVKISLVQMDDLVSQMERMLAWEDSHPPV